jgi:hypothetical protein
MMVVDRGDGRMIILGFVLIAAAIILSSIPVVHADSTMKYSVNATVNSTTTLNYYVLWLDVWNTTGNSTGTTFYTQGHMMNWPNDIRINNSYDNKTYSTWIQDGWNASYMRLWYNVTDGFTPANKTLVIHYGNATAGNNSNGYLTFTHFDNFEGTTLNTTSNWKLTNTANPYYYSVSGGNLTLSTGDGVGGAILRSKTNTIAPPLRWVMRGGVSREAQYFDIGMQDAAGSQYFEVNFYSPNKVLVSKRTSAVTATRTVNLTTNQTIEIDVNATAIRLMTNDKYDCGLTTQMPTIAMGDMIGAWTTTGGGVRKTYVDWVFTTNWTWQQPAITLFGPEQGGDLEPAPTTAGRAPIHKPHILVGALFAVATTLYPVVARGRE